MASERTKRRRVREEIGSVLKILTLIIWNYKKKKNLSIIRKWTMLIIFNMCKSSIGSSDKYSEPASIEKKISSKTTSYDTTRVIFSLIIHY